MSRLRRLRWRARGWARSRLRASPPSAADERDLAEVEGRIVWIFGPPRSGTTWLLRLLAASPSPVAVPLEEPSFGRHLAAMEYRVPEGGTHLVATRANERLARGESYAFSQRYEQSWRPLLRRLILERVRAEALDRAGGELPGLIVIKEPHGTEGADLIAEVVPASRLIQLVRDPRDVLDSILDAELRPEWLRTEQPDVRALGEAERLGLLEHRAALIVHRVVAIGRAAEIVGPERALEVRYERLRASTEEELGRLYSLLGIKADAEQLRSIVADQSFESIPASKRGPGRVFRAASPGLWRQNLTMAERELLERMLGPTLDRLGYERDQSH